MSAPGFLPFAHGESVRRPDIPRLSMEGLREAVLQRVGRGARIVSFFGSRGKQGGVDLLAVLAEESEGTLLVAGAAAGDRYPALTPDCPQAHWFEREIAEQWAVTPDGHPWLKPIRFHAPYRDGGADPWDRAHKGVTPGITDYFRVEGDEVHEVAVGPVHAGIIEPGHFRFQCHGETVFHLEIELGYQHRGIERRLAGGPDARAVHYMETAAGDTTIGHATAYCHNIESLGGGRVPARGQVLRGVALELERLANHTGDLGALANDVGFLPTAAYCGRIRGDFLNMTALLCGNRFGRGLVRPGGITADLDDAGIKELLGRLAAAERDVAEAVNLLWSTTSVMARFEETGAVSRDDAERMGLVGLAARASGISRDIRHDFPSGIYCYAHIPLVTWNSGDVFARAFVRWSEIQGFIAFVREQVGTLPGGGVARECKALEADALSASLVEGWRGEICHVALTDAAGRLEAYKIVDPSFHNWFGLALALRDQQISDFPLCNKSFNLSYCGHDL